MSSEATISTPLANCLDHQCRVLEGYISIVDNLIAVVVGHESAALIRQEDMTVPDACVPVLSMMLQAAGASSHTLLRLSDRPGLHTRDCYTIARSIVETAVNLCYVMAEGPAAAERAMRHARQKSFRDTERESKIGDSVIRLTLASRPDPSEIDDLEKDTAEFTSRAGREKGWVDASIDDRIAVVGKLSDRAMTALHWARFAVYRHSSEILHGSFFSALFFFGLTAPSGHLRSLAELSEAIGQQHMLVLMAAILALSAVVQAFDSAYGFRAGQKQNNALMDLLKSVPYLRGDSTASD